MPKSLHISLQLLALMLHKKLTVLLAEDGITDILQCKMDKNYKKKKEKKEKKIRKMKTGRS